MENVKGHATSGLLRCRQTLYPLSHQGSGILFLPNMQNVNITRRKHQANPQPRILPRARQERLPKKCSGRCEVHGSGVDSLQGRRLVRACPRSCSCGCFHHGGCVLRELGGHRGRENQLWRISSAKGRHWCRQFSR